jgi:hypothetical protein
MMSTNKHHSPQWAFVIYILASSLLIMIFRFIFPGTSEPLWIYYRNWRFTLGLLEIINLFPALTFSALVLPFGFAAYEDSFQSFSEMFFKRLVTSVIVAICATVIYGALFFLVQPIVKEKEENMRFKGEMYHLAKDNLYKHKEAGEWHEASQFLGICDLIWPNNPDLNDLRVDIEIGLEKIASAESREKLNAREALAGDRRLQAAMPANMTSLSGDLRPVNATQAIEMGRTAFDERRYFDAHWLASLGSRLATEGSAQAASARRLASEAWNKISSLAPNRTEERLYRIYQLKLSGYEAMNSLNATDWIRAFYIFQELLTLTPDDPDAKNFYAASERATKEAAFFIDEMELSLGEILTGAIFSLPTAANGRAVLRFSSITTSPDISYGTGLEYMTFDANSRPLTSVRSRYAKLQPVIINEKPQILVLTHALNRFDQKTSWDSEWLLGRKTEGRIILDVDYEDFLLLSHVRRGLTNLQIDELFVSSQKLGSFGYVSQIFEAEILNRLSTVAFFLPMAVFIIVIAWRYRAVARPRYLIVILLPVLPAVFHGFVFLYRAVFNMLGIWLVLLFSFPVALAACIITLGVILFVSLITLAAQHT